MVYVTKIAEYSASKGLENKTLLCFNIICDKEFELNNRSKKDLVKMF